MPDRPEAEFASILTRWRALPHDIQLQMKGCVGEAVRVAQQALDAYDSNMARGDIAGRNHQQDATAKSRNHLQLVQTMPRGSP